MDLTFKIAAEERELEQIHRLNYKTFVNEIPQHRPNPSGRLVDKFHDENTYLICLHDATLAGMLAVRDRRPFSLDQKLGNVDAYLPPGHRMCEVRLLAVEPDYRSGRLFWGLARFTARYVVSKRYTMVLISGTTRQEKLYRHLGFVPFGPLVGAPGAQFQPMYLTMETLSPVLRAFLAGRASVPGEKA